MIWLYFIKVTVYDMTCIIIDKKKEVKIFLFLLLLKILNVDRMTALPVDQHSWSTPNTTRIVKGWAKMILRKILGWITDFTTHDKIHEAMIVIFEVLGSTANLSTCWST